MHLKPKSLKHMHISKGLLSEGPNSQFLEIKTIVFIPEMYTCHHWFHHPDPRCSFNHTTFRLYWHVRTYYNNFDGLVQDCSISIANAMEILQSCTKPSIWFSSTKYLQYEFLFSISTNCCWKILRIEISTCCTAALLGNFCLQILYL